MIPEIEQKTAAEIRAFQTKKLKKQLAYLQAHSPYYQQIFQQEKIDISDIHSLEDLGKLPITTKEDLLQNNADFFCVSTEKIIDYSSTSGTTGKPVNFGMTENDLERLAYNEAISFACAGIKKTDTVQLMTTMDRRFMAGLAYFLGLRKLGAAVIRTGSGIPALQWESILSHRPKYLISVPSFLLKLIDYAEKNNIDLNTCGVKAAICIGEPLRTQDFKLSALAKRITEKWNIQLFSTYASTEMCSAFTECEYFKGGHQHPELIITEVLDDNNQPVKPGEIGEFTITTLGVEALPLLRYKTGDLVKLHEEPCECGRNTPRVGPVIGRAKQMIKYKGTTLFPPAIHNVLNQFEEILKHLIFLKTNNLGLDEVVVKILSEDMSAEFIENLKEAFQAKIRVIPNIEFITSTEMNKILQTHKNRKPRWVIDER